EPRALADHDGELAPETDTDIEARPHTGLVRARPNLGEQRQSDATFQVDARATFGRRLGGARERLLGRGFGAAPFGRTGTFATAGRTARRLVGGGRRAGGRSGALRLGDAVFDGVERPLHQVGTRVDGRLAA